MWVGGEKKIKDDTLPFFHQKGDSVRPDKQIFQSGPSFHINFLNYYSTSLFRDPHKNLLYKRNINLYKYLQREGRGEQGI